MEVERGIREEARLLRGLLIEAVRKSRALPVLDRYPRPEEVEATRWNAEVLWALMKGMNEGQQLAVVRVVRACRSWALMEKVCAESENQASSDIERAAFLARLAREIAERVEGPEEWRRFVLGYAALHAPNVLRVAGELGAARVDLEAAKALWSAGSDPNHVLDPGRVPARQEVAVLLLAEGRGWAAEVKLLAAELVGIFESKKVHLEALAALRLFAEAAEREEATVELARSILRYLLQARHDQGLRFAGSGILGAAAGIESAAFVGYGLQGLGTAAGSKPQPASDQPKKAIREAVRTTAKRIGRIGSSPARRRQRASVDRAGRACRVWCASPVRKIPLPAR